MKLIDKKQVIDAIEAQQDGTGMTFEALSHAVRDIQLLPTVEQDDDCISRQDVIEKIDQDISMFEKAGHCKSADILKHVKRIVKDDLPSVQPERKTGFWIDDGCDIDGTHYIKCSSCKCDIDGYVYDFCPNCGADMRGDQDE